MRAVKKIIVALTSVMLVIAIVVAVAVGINHAKKYAAKDDFPSENDGMSTTSKAIASMCQPTDYKEMCIQTLNKAIKGNDSAADPKVLVKAAITATMGEIKSAHNLSTDLKKKVSNDPMNKMALSDCEDLLTSAVDELQASFSEVGDKELHTLPDRVNEIKNWLSAVVSYQQTCMDGITHPEVKSAMTNGMLNATQMTSNALAMVSEISTVLAGFNISMDNFKLPPSRRLLEVENHGLDEEGLPTWLSGSDRRLLAFNDKSKVKPNVVVAKDGSGNFKTIADALRAVPKKSNKRWVIYVKAGIYKENVVVEKDTTNIFMYGDGPRRSVVTGSKNFVDGTPTYQTATFAVEGNGFICKSMGFRNTAGPEKHQAVALRVKGDLTAFYNCRMDAYQDTLYVQTHRQFYRNCVISGTVDFIFGDSAVVIQNCLLVVRKPMPNQQCIVTAQGRSDRRETTGIVIHNCRIVPEAKLVPTRFSTRTYLGRPWKEFSRTVIMESTLADFIHPDGYMPWDGDFALKTLYYAEYENRGPGARTTRRVRWPGVRVIRRSEALKFTPGSFVQGNLWLRYTGAPYMLGLKH